MTPKDLAPDVLAAVDKTDRTVVEKGYNSAEHLIAKREESDTRALYMQACEIHGLTVKKAWSMLRSAPRVNRARA